MDSKSEEEHERIRQLVNANRFVSRMSKEEFTEGQIFLCAAKTRHMTVFIRSFWLSGGQCEITETFRGTIDQLYPLC